MSALGQKRTPYRRSWSCLVRAYRIATKQPIERSDNQEQQAVEHIVRRHFVIPKLNCKSNQKDRYKTSCPVQTLPTLLAMNILFRLARDQRCRAALGCCACFIASADRLGSGSPSHFCASVLVSARSRLDVAQFHDQIIRRDRRTFLDLRERHFLA
jgi:hypothetical protein